MSKVDLSQKNNINKEIIYNYNKILFVHFKIFDNNYHNINKNKCQIDKVAH